MKEMQRFEDYFEVYDTADGQWSIRQTRHDTNDFRFLLTYEEAERIYESAVDTYGEDMMDILDSLIEEYGIDQFAVYCIREGYNSYDSGDFPDSYDAIRDYIREMYPFDKWFKDYRDCVFDNVGFVSRDDCDEEFNPDPPLINGPEYAEIIFDDELKTLLNNGEHQEYEKWFRETYCSQ